MVIPGSVKNIGDYAFSRKAFETHNPITGQYNYQPIPEFSTLTISEGVEVIGERAFRNHLYGHIIIPSTVTKIGKESFKHEKLPKKGMYLDIRAKNIDMQDSPVDEYFLAKYNKNKRKTGVYRLNIGWSYKKEFK